MRLALLYVNFPAKERLLTNPLKGLSTPAAHAIALISGSTQNVWPPPQGAHYYIKADIINQTLEDRESRAIETTFNNPISAKSICSTGFSERTFVLWVNAGQYFVNQVIDFDSLGVGMELNIIGVAIEGTDDGGLVVLHNDPSSNGDIGLQGLGHELNIVWNTSFGGDSVEAAKDIIRLTNGDYLITATTRSYGAGGDDVYLIRTGEILTDADEQSSALPIHHSLSAAFPNPFNPSTQIQYNIASQTAVSLNVYDLLGRNMTILVNEVQNAGEYSVMFDGAGLPSGVYIYRLQAGEFSDAKKMVLMK
jgi:hypothetical protein